MLAINSEQPARFASTIDDLYEPLIRPQSSLPQHNVRLNLVRQLKLEISLGIYESQDKIDRAVDAIARELIDQG